MNDSYVLSDTNSLNPFELHFAHLIDEVSKTMLLGLFNFRSSLNVYLLFTVSGNAKKLSSLVLEIADARSEGFIFDGQGKGGSDE